MTEQVPFSPIALVGTITLLVAYVVAAWCVFAGIAGNARKSRRLVTSSVYGLYGFGAMIALAVNHRRHRDMIGYVVATIMVVQVFFISLLIFTKNPFSTFITNPPIDGKGLNPALQNYWMVIHPPSLYTGFVAATIPFAFAIGALAWGGLDHLWFGSVRG